MEWQLAALGPHDGKAVIDIFNHYVENSFAAFPEVPVPYHFYSLMLDMAEGYPTVGARTGGGEFAGFGLLRPYHTLPVFARTAEITCFLKPGFTGRGLGRLVLEHLLEAGRRQGLTSLLACISSLNGASLGFHARNGFTECGRFTKIGCKRGTLFDVVYMQRMLAVGPARTAACQTP